ncbi:Mycoplasma protein of uncharacterised function, DUF285 [Slackia heliotrinireducens]|uniref:Uncharacterized protein n=1 Tax=Slackia heliotrinireducens (strain ATCC 29202 / DSM 20476 / NCTC 11029 / RHS 1) TaxID=471855 RepID=C7N2Z5_SLAHD|nr:BspA family leucine-rich repeat surface protein [Slackia heliotrinireducens]ACV21516.1 protein of unknown function, DUF285 [Slackia heliotrinireducens DSM 20476]VEG98977.1 Mycoplasma protein of uncharacterised function, DUF285 [Slackia heliotrinireducens]
METATPRVHYRTVLSKNAAVLQIGCAPDQSDGSYHGDIRFSNRFLPMWHGRPYTAVEIHDDIVLAHGAYLFSGLRKLDTIVGLDRIRLLPGAGCEGMFSKTTIRGSLDLGELDVSGVVCMDRMFELFQYEDLMHLYGWDVRSVRSATGMFSRARAVRVMIDNWNLASCRCADGMFMYANIDHLRAQGLNAPELRSAREMFRFATLNVVEATDWHLPKAEDLTHMWADMGHCMAIADLGGWRMPETANATGLFHGTGSLFGIRLDGWPAAVAERAYAEPEGSED